MKLLMAFMIMCAGCESYHQHRKTRRVIVVKKVPDKTVDRAIAKTLRSQ